MSFVDLVDNDCKLLILTNFPFASNSSEFLPFLYINCASSLFPAESASDISFRSNAISDLSFTYVVVTYKLSARLVGVSFAGTSLMSLPVPLL